MNHGKLRIYVVTSKVIPYLLCSSNDTSKHSQVDYVSLNATYA